MRIPNSKILRQAFITTQPANIGYFLGSFFEKSSDHSVGREKRASRWVHLPYWRVLPSAIRDSRLCRSRQNPIAWGILTDLQWAQYCLFLFIRFQDDVFDGQSRDRVAVYASDQCLFEADRIFASYFAPRSWFWKEYRECLRMTTQSIVEVDTLQRSPDTRSEELLEGYARVSAILKVGSAAICALSGNKRAYRRISLFCDEMAKAGQIVDDLRDLDEDIMQNRYNYVANVLRRSEKQMPSRVKSDRLMNHLRVLAVTERIHEEVRVHVEKASDIMAPFEIREMNKYISCYLKRVPFLP